MALIWLESIAISSVIVYFGYRLSKHGDVIADSTGLGPTFAGSLFIALTASLLPGKHACPVLNTVEMVAPASYKISLNFRSREIRQARCA